MPYGIDININFGQTNTSITGLVGSINELNASIKQFQATMVGNIPPTKAANDASVKLINTYDKLKKAVDSAKNAIDQQKKELTELAATGNRNTKAFNDAIERMKVLDNTYVKATANLNKYNQKLNQTTTQTQQLGVANTKSGSTLGALTKGFNSLGAVLGISFGLYGAIRGIQSVIKTIAEFDLAAHKLRSILGETADGMKDIEASAISVGKASIFGAKGVVELQIELAKMGFTKGEIMAMQQAIVNLATATQEELAPSAEVVANIIRSFGLSAGQATMVVDTMGKAFNDSALDLSNFREAIKYVAPIARQANFTFQETVALLEALSNAGIKGSLAGTGLTNILSRLGNENSKFVKTLGHTVEGFDGFIEGMIELKKRGVDLSGIFQLVDRRAAATFSILLEGIDTVKEFKQSLMDASGVMKDQAGVQLESITYQATLLNESWKALMIEIDKGNGIITSTIKLFLELGNAIVTAFGDPAGAAKKLNDELSLSFRSLDNILDERFVLLSAKQRFEYDKLTKQAREYYRARADLINEFNDREKAINDNLFTPKEFKILEIGALKVEFKKALDALDKEVNEEVGDIQNKMLEMRQDFIDKAANKYVVEFLAISKKIGADKADEIERAKLLRLRKEYKGNIDIINILDKALERISVEYAKLKDFKIGDGATDEDSKKANKLSIERLNAEKDALIAIAKQRENDATRELEIASITYEYGVKLLRLQETDLQTYNLKFIKLDEDYTKAKQDIYEKAFEGISKMNDDLLKKAFDTGKTQIEKGKSNIAQDNWDEFIKVGRAAAAEFDKLAKDNPILAMLFGGARMKEKLGNQEITEDQFDTMVEVSEKSFDMIKNQISGLADAWVEATDRIVDARNRAVDEAQQSLETEIELAKAGFASNVTLKRKELAEAKRLRKEALEDQKKAQKAQLAIDTAMTASALITSAAQMIQANAKFGIPGILLALAGLTLIFATFKKFKALAIEQAAVTYGEGGWVKGKYHSQGGTMIEAEKGEYVIKGRSAMKHKALVEAINKDDQISIDRAYMTKLKNGVLIARVSLDDSEDLKAIRKVLEEKGKTVEYYNGYRIEKVGNITTKIYTN